MKLSSVSAAIAAIALAAGVGTVALPEPARADSMWGCTYPAVCFYLTDADWLADRPTASFKDMYKQTLGSKSRGAAEVVNTRNDDGALLYFADGSTRCLGPDNWILSLSIPSPVTAIWIKNAPDCSY